MPEEVIARVKKLATNKNMDKDLTFQNWDMTDMDDEKDNFREESPNDSENEGQFNGNVNVINKGVEFTPVKIPGHPLETPLNSSSNTHR